MTTSKPPWRSTVSCPLNPRALPGRLPFPGPWHARTPRNASCTDFRLRDRRFLHLHRSRAARHRAGRGGDSRGRRRTAKCRGASLPNVIHWGWRGAPAPSNPDRGELSPGPPITPAAPFSLSHDGGLDAAKSDIDRGDAAFRGSFRPQRGGAPPSEKKALGWLKSRATHVRHRGSFGGALVRLHRLDPQRRKSSIIPRPFEAGFSCSHWTIFSMTTSRPPWPSTVSWPLNPRALPGAGCDFQAPGIPEHPGTPPAPISLSETAGLAACGETGMVASLSGPVVAIRSGQPSR